jgi:hypothetical protein
LESSTEIFLPLRKNRMDLLQVDVSRTDMVMRLTNNRSFYLPAQQRRRGTLV